jgi:hypothetical protein
MLNNNHSLFQSSSLETLMGLKPNLAEKLAYFWHNNVVDMKKEKCLI